MARMRITRFVSGGFYTGWLVWAAGHFNFPQVFGMALAMFLPLVLVWFPHESNELALGNLQKNGLVHSPVPSWLIAVLGWLLFLFVPPLAGLVAGP